MAPRQPDPFVGKNLLDGQFAVNKKVGAGGMGAVYRAVEKEMGREVAIKILHPKLKGRADLASRFRREARAMSQLTHPNTARVFRYGELEDGSLYFVMELLEGKNLNQVVRREGAMEPRRAVPILIQVCHALQEAHDLGIVHRDLKPENIFICNGAGLVDFPKVLDFGLAKVTEQQMKPGSLILTQEGMVFGTPEFMSPEQARGHTIDARSDIYALANILYEALTGKLPFRAKAPMEYVNKHVSAKPIPLNKRVEGRVFPEGLWKVIEKALEKLPEHRYQTANAFAEALEPYREALMGLDGKQHDTQSPPEEKTKAAPQKRGSTAPPTPPVNGISTKTLVLVAVGCMVLGGVIATVLM